MLNKNKLLFVFAMLLSTTMYTQDYDLVVEKVDGTTTISVSRITKISFALATCGVSTVTYAGVTYNTVLIGSQCWLKENLNVGTMINVSGDQTSNSILEKYCYNDQESNCTTYGGLYQWAEAVQYQGGATNTTESSFSGNVRGICPPGWHIPSSSEIATLYNFVGGDGNKLKAVGQGSGDGAGTNTSGFSGLLAGTSQQTMGSGSGTFRLINEYGLFFGSSPGDTGASTASGFYFYDIYNYLSLSGGQKSSSKSVRCLRD